MHTLPPNAQEAIRDDLEGTHKYSTNEFGDSATARHRSVDEESDTASIPVTRDR
jgi:phospholipid/cholesterol/gamma-HCH transport system ATP-binding protein